MQAGAEAEHADFLVYLRSDDGADLLRKVSLTDYAIFQRDLGLDVIFKSDRPVIIASFLRNKRLWPPFWEFEQAGLVDVPADKELIFRWTRG